MNAVYFSTEIFVQGEGFAHDEHVMQFKFFKPFTIGYLNFEPKAGIEIDLLYSL